MRAKRGVGKPKGRTSAIASYRMLLIFLYGKHSWIERDGTKCRIPVQNLAKHLKIPAKRVKEYLYRLEDMGFIHMVRWNKLWITIRPITPEGMAEVLPALEVEPEPTVAFMHQKFNPEDGHEKILDLPQDKEESDEQEISRS